MIIDIQRHTRTSKRHKTTKKKNIHISQWFGHQYKCIMKRSHKYMSARIENRSEREREKDRMAERIIV